jgi:hypothetical protein
VQFVDALLGVGVEIELRVSCEGRFKLLGHQLGEVAAHALWHSTFGLTRDPDEQPHLQPQRDGEEQDEPEANAPVQAAAERTTGAGCRVPGAGQSRTSRAFRHQRTYNRYPRP